MNSAEMLTAAHNLGILAGEGPCMSGWLVTVTLKISLASNVWATLSCPPARDLGCICCTILFSQTLDGPWLVVYS